MEDNTNSLSILGSRSLARSKTSLAIVEKLLIEKANRDRIKAEFYFNLGVERERTEDFREAIKYYSNAIEIDPNYKEAYHNRGVMYDEWEEYDKSVADYTKAIKIDPNYFPPYFKIARVKFILDDNEGGMREYLRVIELDPHNLFAYYKLIHCKFLKLNDADGAIALLSKLINQGDVGRSPFGTRSPYDFRGDIKLKIGDHIGAIIDFSKDIELHPNENNTDSYRKRAFAKSNLKDYEEALLDLTKVIEFADDEDTIYRGIVKRLIKDYNGAIEELTSIINYAKISDRIALEDIEFAYNERGVAKYYVKDYAGAIEDFSTSIRYGDKFNGFYLSKLGYTGIIRENNAQIDNFIKSSSLPYPIRILSYYYRGLIKELINDNQGAEIDFEKTKILIQDYANRGSL